MDSIGWDAAAATPVEPTGVDVSTYLDLMQIAIDAYPVDRIRRRETIRGDYLTLQPFSRLTNVLSCLISAGRWQDRIALCEWMIGECCAELARLEQVAFADFSTKEIMIAIDQFRAHASDSVRSGWLAELAKVDPMRTYAFAIRSPDDEARQHNIGVYNMVGEWLRSRAGLTNTDDYFARHWPVQLRRFDDNGMYRDPHCPLLYDLTTRCQIQLMLGAGYDGPFTGALDALLCKAGMATLLMQSAAGEFGFGGRSNQFLFNEALIAANCEYEAARYRALGDDALAGAFKRAGHLAVQAIQRWLSVTPPRHLKNFFPIDSGHGTEGYGHYDSYMITLGAFLVIAYRFADDSIPERACPAETGGFVAWTSSSFHKVFANAGDYSLEIDTAADPDYDATGLGRLHRRDVPTELALSVPLSAGSGYTASTGERCWASISPGWRESNGEIRYLAEVFDADPELTVLTAGGDRVEFRLRYDAVEETYALDVTGLRYSATVASGAAWLRVPVLRSNGIDTTTVRLVGSALTVELNGSTHRVDFDGEAVLGDEVYANRNGLYSLLDIRSAGPTVSAHFSLR